jgi:hypothetical protein
VRHVACVGEENAFRIVVVDPQGEKVYETSKRRYKINLR